MVRCLNVQYLGSKQRAKCLQSSKLLKNENKTYTHSKNSIEREVVDDIFEPQCLPCCLQGPNTIIPETFGIFRCIVPRVAAVVLWMLNGLQRPVCEVVDSQGGDLIQSGCVKVGSLGGDWIALGC